MNKEIVAFLRSKHYMVIEDNVESKINIWNQWYKGDVEGFHKHQIYQGKKNLNKNRLTLNMPQRVCRDWADLLLNEKTEINCDDDKTQNALNEILKNINFKVRANNLIERSFALGGGFFIQYWDGKKTNQKYITQEHMLPLSYDSGRLTECAFVSVKTIKGVKYIYIETHEKDENGNYVVKNYLTTEGKNGSLQEVPKQFYTDNEIEEEWYTNSPVPKFQQIKPNIANKYKFDSPYGISIFSGVTDLFKSIDLIYDGLYSEFKIGKKRIFVKNGVATFNIDKDGNTVPVFDTDDEAFYSVEDRDEGEPIQECNMALRVNEYNSALQTQLNLISQACGFGTNAYKWDNGNIATATQVISENSKLFRTLKKHELLLTEAIIDMARSLLEVEKANGRAAGINVNTEITVNFDDSIIEDTAEIKRQALQDVSMGIISKTEYFRQVYKLTDEQAKAYQKQMADEISEEAQQLAALSEPQPE